MNLYPALLAQMGSWKYYIAKMKMKEVAKEVDFAYDVYDDRTLSDAIQRDLSDSRVKKEIVAFLARRPDRFFASLVVAAIGGNPKFYPVKITDEREFSVFADQEVDEAFGVLTFSGKQRYYALDGQHRLKAIKTLLDPNDPANASCPEGFGNEEISVLIVIKRDEPQAQFLQAYRRLFSSLNRYARPTGDDTNIIMDEDDAFAILTRRLISEHDFFKWTGKQKESRRVQMKGKNLKEGDEFFTSLQTLYSMNQELLTSRVRASIGWGNTDPPEKKVDTFIMFRPEEEYLDALYAELVVYWNSLVKVLPVLKEDAGDHKDHSAEGKDNLLFWPIGQELLATIARQLFNELPEKDLKKPTVESASKVLAPLSKVEWALHREPWRFFLLTRIDDSWKMRSEGRAEAMVIAERMLRWIVGLDPLKNDEKKKLREQWQSSLVPAPSDEEKTKMWTRVEKLADSVSGKKN
jgi:DNA sulfur modification protein DndB